MAPPAVERATLEKDRRADPGAVMDAKSSEVEYGASTFHHIESWVADRSNWIIRAIPNLSNSDVVTETTADFALYLLLLLSGIDRNRTVGWKT